MKNGMAALEEFLQEKYVENYESIDSNDGSKVEKLAILYKDFFYNPQDDGFGTVNYMTDSEGHALYLIIKSGLPKEIQEMLNAGNCGAGKTGSERYMEYVSLTDVYGVTGNLKVYYSYGDGTFLGINSSDELDNDSTGRIVLSSSNQLAGIIKSDGTDVTLEDAQKVKKLTIDENSGITSLQDIYVLGSLQSLTLSNLNLTSLEGIQNAQKLNYLFISGCVISDYAALSKVNKLTYLYLHNIDDGELISLCLGIQHANFPNLKYFGVAGVVDYLSKTDNSISGGRKASVKYITSLNPIGTLDSECVGNVEYLNIQCNEISDEEDSEGNITKYALENLSRFNKIKLLRAERNKITSLRGIENATDLKWVFLTTNNIRTLKELEKMDSLYLLRADSNKLGIDEVYNVNGGITDEDKGKNPNKDALASLEKKKELYYLYLDGNPDLKWVGYIYNDTAIRCLYFGDGSKQTNCINMVDSEVAKIRNILQNCGINKSYPNKYWLALLDENDDNLEVILKGMTITLSQFNGLKTYTNIKTLDLNSIKIIVSDSDSRMLPSTAEDLKDIDINEVVNNVLKYITNLKYLRISSSSTTSLYTYNDLTFLEGVDKEDSSDDISLIELAALGTLVSTQRQKADGTWDDYNEGLKMLVTKRYDLDSFYCDGLTNLEINEKHTNLGTIESVTARLCNYTTSSKFYGSAYIGVFTNVGEVMESIGNCSTIKRKLLFILG